MKKIFISVLVLSVLGFALPAYCVDWQSDLNAAKKTALKDGKPLMIMFYSPKSKLCEMMDNDVFSDVKVNALLKMFICVRIDIEKNPQLASMTYRVNSAPAFIFYGRGEKPIKRFYHTKDKEEFAEVLKDTLAKYQ